MKPKSDNLARPAEEAAPQQPERPTGPAIRMRSEVVVKEDGFVPLGSGGLTIGQQLDSMIAAHAKHDGQLRNFSIEIDDETWAAIKASNPTFPGVGDDYR